VSQWRQPWQRLRVAGRRCRLQILDPQLAFELERDLLDRLGDPLAKMLADPSAVADAVGFGPGLVEIDAAEAMLRRTARLVALAISAMTLDGAWVAELFERTVLDRFEVDGQHVEDWQRWRELELPASARWVVLGAQVSQTFGPLWSRAPYELRAKKPETYGVPSPGSPKAVQWAAALARQGLASVDEILSVWTPVRLIEVVETAAEAAEIQRRASDAASKVAV